jgi:glycosyltransferase involved in cell wall biosynthesis
MLKQTLLFRGPVRTRSGYGSHSRDLLEVLRKMDLYEIKIDSCVWGNTPLTALEPDNEFHEWIEANIVTEITSQPDIYITVTVPNEFQRMGKINIGITAGIESTVAPKSWVDGCNRMDHIITTSTFSRDVLLQTVYNETENNTGKLIKQYRIEKPISVLFEGADTNIYNNKYSGIDLDIESEFSYIFVGHWLKGDLGQDRKDVGMMIKCFVDAFKNEEKKPSLILKTSAATFSIKQREILRKKIEDIVKQCDTKTPPPIYLLFGELSNNEMNELYNHPNVKAMVSITKGEGFGRPLLEFTMTGKPIIASNWSGHKDFLTMDKAIMVGGSLTEVHESVIDDFIIKGSKWFTANYNEFSEVLKIVQKDYDKFLEKSEELRKINTEKFSLDAMKNVFETILSSISIQPKQQKITLPKLTKIN